MKRLRGPDKSFPVGRPRPNPLSVADLGGAAFRRAAQARSAIQTVLPTGTRSLSRIRYRQRGRGRIGPGRAGDFMNNPGQASPLSLSD